MRLKFGWTVGNRSDEQNEHKTERAIRVCRLPVSVEPFFRLSVFVLRDVAGLQRKSETVMVGPDAGVHMSFGQIRMRRFVVPQTQGGTDT